MGVGLPRLWMQVHHGVRHRDIPGPVSDSGHGLHSRGQSPDHYVSMLTFYIFLVLWDYNLIDMLLTFEKGVPLLHFGVSVVWNLLLLLMNRASIKLRLLFSRTVCASQGLSLNISIACLFVCFSFGLIVAFTLLFLQYKAIPLQSDN